MNTVDGRSTQHFQPGRDRSDPWNRWRGGRISASRHHKGLTETALSPATTKDSRHEETHRPCSVLAESMHAHISTVSAKQPLHLLAFCQIHCLLPNGLGYCISVKARQYVLKWWHFILIEIKHALPLGNQKVNQILIGIHRSTEEYFSPSYIIFPWKSENKYLWGNRWNFFLVKLYWNLWSYIKY